MIAQPGEEIGRGAESRCSRTASSPASRIRPTRSPSTIRRACRRAMIGYSVGPALANVDSVDIDRARRRRPWRLSAHHPRSDRARQPDRHHACRPWSAARSTRIDAAVVTVGSFHAGTKHNIISDEARLQLTVRSFTPEVRRRLLDGIAAHRPRRGDRRRHPRGPDAGGDDPRGRIHAGDGQHRGADPRAPPLCSASISARRGSSGRRR